jgi:hypothetical protein
MAGPERRRLVHDRVVLQRFRGELQLLDSRGGGEGRDSFPEEGASRGSGFNRAATSERRPAFSGPGVKGDKILSIVDLPGSTLIIVAPQRAFEKTNTGLVND